MILVHQMAKVASRSWVEAAKAGVAENGPIPLHCHYVVPRNRERIQAALSAPAEQTIANMYLPRNLLRVGASVWKQIETWQGAPKRIRVISGMRDPVARSISLIVFMCDFYGHVSLPLGPHIDVPPEYLASVLRENWRLVLEREEPRQTFEWLLWYLTDGFRTWFADELGGAFGVNVLDKKFDRRGAALRITASPVDVLVYRVEDMTPGAPGYARLLEEAGAFLETKLAAFPSVNTSTARRSRALSEGMRRSFRLPDSMLGQIYGEPVVNHFYRGEEIAAFKRRWSESA